MPEALVYLNGCMLPASQAMLPIYDAGVVMGATVTEITRTFRHQPFKLDEHLGRLFRSLQRVQFAIGETRDQLAAISRELVNHNAPLLPAGGELGLNHFVTAGPVARYGGLIATQNGQSTGGSRHPHPGPLPEGEATRRHRACTVCINTFPLQWQLWAHKMREGTRLVTPSIRHVPPQCIDPSVKHRSRMHFLLADQEARRSDPDASALLLDLDGNITETSTANFLFVEGGTIVSPTMRNALPGISRATVIELAAQLAIPFVERDSQLDQAMNADEAFLTSTPYCLMPVTRINGSPVGAGSPGPIFRRLLDAWSQLVNVDIERQIVDGAATLA